MRRGEVWWTEQPQPKAKRPVVLLSRLIRQSNLLWRWSNLFFLHGLSIAESGEK